MTHKMILVSHDFKEVYKIVVARRKQADVADQSARPVSGNTRANSSPSAPQSLDESE